MLEVYILTNTDTPLGAADQVTRSVGTSSWRRNVSTAQLLDDVLTSLGYPPVDAAQEATVFGFHVADRNVYKGRWALFEPLCLRGWCEHFDSEGPFFEPQEHSKLIATLLTLAGVHPLPEIRDTWLRNVGWVFEIRTGARRVAYHFRDPDRDVPIDYCELGLVKALLDDWLAPERTLVHFPTGDQTAFCCLMPRSVYKELCDWGFIIRYANNFDAQEEIEPSPDRLVLWPSRDEAEYMENVVALTGQQADAMLTGTPIARSPSRRLASAPPRTPWNRRKGGHAF
jgi:hypothetical protein